MPPPPERALSGAALPLRLRELPEPPARVFVRGELPRGPAVAIVGTRDPTPAALGYAHQLAFELSSVGVSVLSGGAEGIDTAAHLGALDAGGMTVVVAPAGFDRPFPPENAELFRRVVDSGGGYVSLEQSAVAAGRARYFQRNHCLAALAHVVVVVEAPIISGARNTAKWARRLGRPLFVCGSPPWNPTGLGCVLELGLGARALGSHRDILKVLGELRAHAVRVPSPAPQPTPDEPSSLPLFDAASDRERALEAILAGATTVDAVCVRTGLGAARVQQLVLTLTLDGVLVPDSAGRLSVANR